MNNSRKLLFEIGRSRLAVSIPEAAALTCIGRSTLYRALRRKELTGKKIGRRTLVLVSDLRDYLDKLPDFPHRSGGH